jgi:sodium/hydrogen antiporter
LVGSLLMPRPGRESLDRPIPAHQKALYGLGLAFASYGLASLPPRGNGFIAVFVAAIVIGVRRPDLRRYFAEGAEELVEVVKLAIFTVFGSLLTLHGLFGDGWAALAVVLGTFLLARPIAVWIALAGTRVYPATKAFMAWFGPKGVATMTFSLLILSRAIDAGSRIFNIAALAVFASILLHGITDTPGIRWIARRSAAEAEAGDALLDTDAGSHPTIG